MEDFKCKTFAIKDGLLVTAWGDVYTFNYKNSGKFRKLRSNLDRHGYPYVSHRYKHRYVHRLVAECFIPNPKNKPEVDHVNGNPIDCRVSNLRWATASENQNNPITLERMSMAMTNHPSTSKKVYQYTIDGHFIKEWPSVKEIERSLGFSDSGVHSCCRGERPHSHGFQWSYVKHEQMEPAVTRRKKVYQYTLSGEFVGSWESGTEAASSLGGRQCCISDCCRGRQKSAYGFIWSYSPLS